MITFVLTEILDELLANFLSFCFLAFRWCEASEADSLEIWKVMAARVKDCENAEIVVFAETNKPGICIRDAISEWEGYTEEGYCIWNEWQREDGEWF